MSITKKIRINTDFLKIQGGNKRKKKIKPKTPQFLTSNKVKQKLIERIKVAAHKRQNEESKENNEETQSNFKSTFDEAINDLQNIIKERKTKRHRRKKKREVITHISHADDPPYGILKGGKKPLYSEYRKTLKKKIDRENTQVKKPRDTPKLNIPTPIQNISPMIMERQHKLQKLKSQLRTPSKKIRKKKYTLGKRGGKVGIIIKSSKTRRKIKREHRKLKKKDMDSIKLYLKKHGLIKVGSNAPDQILRSIYETSILTGDVYNNNNTILLHNFLNSKEKQYK